ncbi:hypothetical protein E3J74_08110 [Candidatus Bathyarchaeota archaeon]|nr:MAG: hypothetical protein E3J74_08110 [Candidatus Bathyarchaeota archaeon]
MASAVTKLVVEAKAPSITTLATIVERTHTRLSYTAESSQDLYVCKPLYSSEILEKYVAEA